MQPLEPTLYTPHECEDFLIRWISACRDARRLLVVLGSKAEAFVEVSQYSLMEVVWREDVPLNLSEEALTRSPQMIKALCKQNGPPGVTGSFWMVIVRNWRANHGRDPGHQLLPTLKFSLLKQIRASREGDCLWCSAWEGVKLIDEQVAAKARLIDEERE